MRPRWGTSHRKWTRIAASLVICIALLVPAPAGAHEASPAVPVHQLTTAELDLLARVTSAEAQGEPYEGQVAVAAVVLNRVRSRQFPPTLAGVVYQRYQFESVAIGTADLWPVPSAVRAARDAANGWDPTRGAIYFFNPAKTSNKFLWSRPLARIIGNHRFTY